MAKNKIILSENIYREVHLNWQSHAKKIGEVHFTCSPWKCRGIPVRCTGCGQLAREKYTRRQIQKITGEIPEVVQKKILLYKEEITYGCCNRGDLPPEEITFQRLLLHIADD